MELNRFPDWTQPDTPTGERWKRYVDARKLLIEQHCVMDRGEPMLRKGAGAGGADLLLFKSEYDQHVFSVENAKLAARFREEMKGIIPNSIWIKQEMDC